MGVFGLCSFTVVCRLGVVGFIALYLTHVISNENTDVSDELGLKNKIMRIKKKIKE
jgi:hypothetical protein